MKKCILKSFVSCALVFGMFLLSSLTVFASGGIVPAARTCACGNGTYQPVSTSYGSWYTASEVKCTHKNYGTDLKQKRSKTVTYKCNSCGRGYHTTSTDSRTICHGYNS